MPLLGFNNGGNKNDKKRREKIPLTPMGVLAYGSVHARPSAQPTINVSRNFPAQVSAEWPSNISKGKKEYNHLAPVQGSYILVQGSYIPFFLSQSNPNIFVS